MGTNWKIEDIIKRTSIQRYMHNTEEIDFSQYTLYGKWTAHYLHPPTSLVFAHMAFYRKWSFFLQIREPINRLWSVQQHWHKYDGTDYEIRESAANNVWTKYEKLPILKQLVTALQNMTVSTEHIIGLYYRLYFDTLNQQRSVEPNEFRNGYAFELTSSLYFVQIIIWLKQFERIGFDENSVFNHFRIIQFEHITKDLSAAKLLIYCWHKENVESIKDCSYRQPESKIETGFDNKVAAANGHIWSIEMAWKERLKFMELFRACNEKLDNLVKERPRIVLGEWVSYDAMYDQEMMQEHNDSIIVKHDERNTKSYGKGRDFIKGIRHRNREKQKRKYRRSERGDLDKMRLRERQRRKRSS